MATLIESFYPEAKFGGFTDVDGTVRFFVRINTLLKPEFTLLDVGCGRGGQVENLSGFRRTLQDFKGRVQRVIGIDVDPVGDSNPTLDEFRLIDGPKWPVEDASIDIIVSDWTMEHIENPDGYLDECLRVLKPGGYLCLRTANKLGYIAFASSLIPNKLHQKILGRVQSDRESKDVFPTFYKCNTVGRLRKALRARNFKYSVYGHEAEPSYLGFAKWAYRLGVVYQKVAPKVVGSTIYVFAQKS